MKMEETCSQNPPVSVIVPIYKVEPYLRQCVDSIINQTYKNLEIILVDDGSPDDCPAICDEYRLRDDRIKVIHKPNGGLSDARNAGLRSMTGDYAAFIDGDDYYAPDAIENLLTRALKKNVEIVCMGAALVREDEICYERPVEELVSSEEFFKGVCLGTRTPSVCTKLFSRDILRGREFKKDRLNEDFYFVLSAMFQPFRIAISAYTGYFYRQRPGSIPHSDSKNSLADAIRNCMDLMNMAEERSPASVPYVARMGLHQSCVMLMVIPAKRITRENQFLQLALACIRQCRPYLRGAALRPREKVIIRCALLFPVAVAAMIGFLRRLRK